MVNIENEVAGDVVGCLMGYYDASFEEIVRGTLVDVTGGKENGDFVCVLMIWKS